MLRFMKFRCVLRCLFSSSFRSISGPIWSSTFFFTSGSTKAGGWPRTSYVHCISAVAMTRTPTDTLPYSYGVKSMMNCWPGLPTRGSVPDDGRTEKTVGDSALKVAVNSASAANALARAKETEEVLFSVDSIMMTSSTSGALAWSMSSYFQRPPDAWRTTRPTCALRGLRGIHCTATGRTRSSLSGPASSKRRDARSSVSCSSGMSVTSTANWPVSSPEPSRPSRGRSMSVWSCWRARMARTKGLMAGRLSAKPTMGYVHTRLSSDWSMASTTAAECSCMSSAEKVKDTWSLARGATDTPSTRFMSSAKTPGAEPRESRRMLTCTGMSKGLTKLKLPDVMDPSSAATSVTGMVVGRKPMPRTVYIQSAMRACTRLTEAGCSVPRREGVYCSTTVRLPYGATVRGPPPLVPTSQLRALDTCARSAMGSPSGFSTVTRCSADLPSSHSRRGSSSGTGWVPLSRSLYQNSPTLGLRKLTAPDATPATSGAKTSRYLPASLGATMRRDSPSRPSPSSSTSNSTSVSSGLLTSISSCAAVRTAASTSMVRSAGGGLALISTVYQR
mmetsp:Transcript_21751/g.58597  ORF Transcript_21751/g.58597 Transcript_21751/m.58597 type:complete len:560 (+) Transcript_21751:199-1878(+)